MAWLVFVGGLAVVHVLCRRPFECNQTAKSLGKGSTGLDLSATAAEAFLLCRTSRYVGYALLLALPGPKTLLQINSATPFSFSSPTNPVAQRDSCPQKGKPAVETLDFAARCLPTPSVAFSRKPWLTVSLSVGIVRSC